MVSITGGATASQTFSIPENGNAEVAGLTIPFMTYGMSFTPFNSGPVTITLNAEPGTSMGITTKGGEYIDNVVLSVPEPQTWGLLVLAIAVLGVSVRMRHQLTAHPVCFQP